MNRNQGTSDLPQRPGQRPLTTTTNPHVQLNQQPSDGLPRRKVIDSLSELPVAWADSVISVPGSQALTLPRDAALGPREAFLIDAEFAHLHPAPDYSLHLVLPPAAAEVAIQAGWAGLHPTARLGFVSPGAVMGYAPRNDAEVEIVADLLWEPCAYAIGLNFSGDAYATGA